MDNKILLSDLAEKLASQSDISKRSAESFLRTFFSLIEQNMLNDRFVKIKDFGTFKLVDVNDRESVNVATGERIQIEGHSKISFTAEGKLRDLVNRPFAHFSNIELEESTQIEEINAVDKSFEEHKTLSNSVETNDSGAENEAFDTPVIAPLAATETAVHTATAGPTQAQPTHEVSLPQPQPVPATAAQPAEHSTQAQEIAQALLKIMQTAQGTQLAPQAIVCALQEMLQMPSTASQQPVTGSANTETDSEDSSTKPQKRRERRRARFEGKRRLATTIQEETAATPNTAIASLTAPNPQEQEPSAPAIEEEVVSDTAATQEETPKASLRMKDRNNRRRRTRHEIRKATITPAAEEEAQRDNTVFAPQGPVQDENTPLATPPTGEATGTTPTALATTGIPAAETTGNPATITPQNIPADVATALQEMTQSPSDLLTALQEVTQNPQDVLTLLQELTQAPAATTPQSANVEAQPVPTTAPAPEYDDIIKPYARPTHFEEPPVETHNDADEEEEKQHSRWWKIALAVGVGLAILAGIFYLLYFYEPKKDIPDDPLGVEELKRSNAALVPDAVSAEEINAKCAEYGVNTTEDEPVAAQIEDVKQLPGGKYEIAGTYTVHKISEGETMKMIATKYFGNPDLTEYIAFFNNISQSDHIETGNTLKIPALREHGSEDLINK